MEARTLICDGRLVATAELGDTYGYDTDAYDHLFLFRQAVGYEVLVIGRTEGYRDEGDLASVTARVDVTFAPSTATPGEMIDARWPGISNPWWQLLESGRHNDAELHAAWVPERMRRDLDSASVYDKPLGTQTGYFNGTRLPAEGRNAPNWPDKAVADMAVNLEELGWEVRPGPALSPEVKPGGIFSTGTVVAGSLWASRFGQKATVIVRVDGCGEIYARLAEPEDLLDARATNLVRDAAPPYEDLAHGDARHIGDAVDEFLRGLHAPESGIGFEL